MHNAFICTVTAKYPARRRCKKRNKPMIVTWVLSKIRNYLQYRETVSELSRLTDRELDDLGISRFDIESIARGGSR
jgi:uncharacterized protein YjiS (DUF1127 family)